ncbi:MAG: selenide, water dikinase SelD [Bacteroidota bacterium]
MQTTTEIRLTQYSHGAGCGCKIAPAVLEQMLAGRKAAPDDARLLVGNHSRDDAAVYDLGTGQALISTTDFFMPIVDDPHTFGRIAAANAISDVYAMGGTPVLAIAILGWPVDKLGPEVAGAVLEGGRSLCHEAGIALAGGHSIDSPEPIFGLAVNGLVAVEHLKTNSGAQPGDVLFLTKPLGVGILATAEKRGLLQPGDVGRAARQMMQLNRIGEALGRLPGVHALTDVTGFGLLGHLTEVCAGSRVQAEVTFDAVPTITDLAYYLDQGTIPGGTKRNWASYGHHIGPLPDAQRAVLCDPQTSGGLLIAAAPDAVEAVQDTLRQHHMETHAAPIGHVTKPGEGDVLVRVA